MGNDKVTFRWRDNAHGNQMKWMTLDAEEFIRRFLLYILSADFRKIHHYGLFASCGKGNRLDLCRRLTDTPQPSQELPPMALLEKILGKDFDLCLCCKLGHFSREPPCFSECWYTPKIYALLGGGKLCAFALLIVPVQVRKPLHF